MKISDLIKELNEIQSNCGDLTVVVKKYTGCENELFEVRTELINPLGSNLVLIDGQYKY
jgi:hypothetical protein